MMDYTNIKTTLAEPEAGSMIETFRAIGYSIEAAISDIVDNSISAEAKNIWIDYAWAGPDTVLSITDDGHGMDSEELIQAMRPGSIGPHEERSTSDLGRFGLGLKTASFSQCRKFCVSSKRNNSTEAYWAWDLDYVNQQGRWKLLMYKPNNLDIYRVYECLKSGTMVLWWDMDRLTKDTQANSERSKARFFATIENVKRHLSMVFHRFIENGINIYVRNKRVEPWDPFMIGYSGLQPRPEASLLDGKVVIKGFVLPHRSKLSNEEYNRGKGPRDSWTDHQGFYLYRCRRLIMAGDWFGMFKREAHYDLCRVRIDISNDMDNDWQIDIKKSIARPPMLIREALMSVAKDVRSQAVEVYRHKGKVIKRKLSRSEFFPVWEEKLRHGKRYYKLNRNHPLLRDLLQEREGFSSRLEKLFQFIEETVPVPLITLQESEGEMPHAQPFEGKSSQMALELMKTMYTSLLEDGLSRDQAMARIANIEPFNYFIEALEHLEK